MWKIVSTSILVNIYGQESSIYFLATSFSALQDSEVSLEDAATLMLLGAHCMYGAGVSSFSCWRTRR